MEEQSKFYAKAFLLRNVFFKSINEFNEKEDAIRARKEAEEFYFDKYIK